MRFFRRRSSIKVEVREYKGSLPVRPTGDPAFPAGPAGTLRVRVENPEWAVPPTVVSGRQTGGVFDPYSPTGFIVIRDCELIDVAFSGLHLASLSIWSSTFRRCDLAGLRTDAVPVFGTPLPTLFTECRFDGMDLRSVLLGFSRFERCSFRDVRIEWTSYAAEFVECTFSGAISRAQFYGVPTKISKDTRDAYGRKLYWPTRKVNEFRANDFTKAAIHDIDMRAGIDVAAQRWPTGDEYVYLEQFHERARRVREDLRALPDSDRNRKTLSQLDDMLKYKARNNVGTTHFGRRYNPYVKDPEERARVDELWSRLSAAL